MTAIFFKVNSSSTPNKQYMVRRLDTGEWRCECPHFVFRSKECTHIIEGKRAIFSAVAKMKELEINKHQ